MASSSFDPVHQSRDIDSRIVAALERLSEAFRVLLWNEAKQHGVSPIQVQMLAFLRFHPEVRRNVSSLAQEFNMTKATISDAVKTLEQKGFLSRRTLEHDARAQSLDLTPEGIELADKTSDFAAPVVERVASLSQGQKEGLLTSLLQVIYQLNQAGILTVQRMCFTCRFHRQSGLSHYCELLKKPLAVSELRLDCPEHELVTISE